MIDAHRLHTLQMLLHFSKPIRELEGLVGRLPWDRNECLVELTPEIVRNILVLYLHGERNALEIETWANLVESREDIASTPSIRNVVYRLANPLLEGSLTQKAASDLLSELYGLR